MFSNYLIHLGIIIMIFSILGMSLNLALGYTGLVNLGHIAFYGIGAYTSAILVMHHVPFLLALVAAAGLSALAGFVLTFITRKLKGDYLALVTLGFTFMAFSVFINWTEVTRGPIGIPGIPRPDIFGFIIRDNISYFFFTLVVLLLIGGFLYLLTRSRYGRLLEAVRDDAMGLEVFGKNIFRLKYQSMMVSAAIAGIAGSLYAHYISYIDPSTFFLNDMVVILTIVIVGGLASIKGSFFAALIIILIPELLRFVSLPPSMIGQARQILYAVALIGILMYRPKGLFGKVDLE